MERTESMNMHERKIVFETRNAQFIKMGFDRSAAADFIISSADNLIGPALDIGTGKGISAMTLAKRDLNVISVDTDAEGQAFAAFLAKEAGLGDRINFVHGDASSLAYPDGHFGCVVMMDVLHHLADSLSVLDEAGRVLKHSGILIIADFTQKGFELLSKVHRQEGREHSIVGISLNIAETILTKKGFVAIDRKTKHMHDVVVLEKKQGREDKNNVGL